MLYSIYIVLAANVVTRNFVPCGYEDFRYYVVISIIDFVVAYTTGYEVIAVLMSKKEDLFKGSFIKLNEYLACKIYGLIPDSWHNIQNGTD